MTTRRARGSRALALAAGIMALPAVACSFERDRGAKRAESERGESVEHGREASAPDENDALRLALVRDYETIQRALAADSIVEVRPAAARLATDAQARLGEAVVPARLKFVIVAAQLLEGEDLETLRVQAKPLGRAIAELVGSAPLPGYATYFCPMADAYWVQSAGAVRNPYFGGEMLDCGERVVEPAESEEEAEHEHP